MFYCVEIVWAKESEFKVVAAIFNLSETVPPLIWELMNSCWLFNIKFYQIVMHHSWIFISGYGRLYKQFFFFFLLTIIFIHILLFRFISMEIFMVVLFNCLISLRIEGRQCYSLLSKKINRIRHCPRYDCFNSTLISIFISLIENQMTRNKKWTGRIKNKKNKKKMVIIKHSFKIKSNDIMK